MRNAFILAARDEIEEVFFQVSSGARNSVDFVLANHFSERDSQFARAHRACERNHHFPAAIKMRDVGVGCVFEDRRVEVSIMAINELADVARLHFDQLLRFVCSSLTHKIFIMRRGNWARIFFGAATDSKSVKQ